MCAIPRMSVRPAPVRVQSPLRAGSDCLRIRPARVHIRADSVRSGPERASVAFAPTAGRRGLFVWAVLLVAFAAPGRAQSGSPLSGQEPLTPERLVTAVLERNPGLEAQRAAMNEAAARIRPAASLDDPMMSVAVAPRTIGSAIGTRDDIEISQALPWWGTLETRAAAARSSADAAAEDVQSLALRLRAAAQSAFADWRYVHAALDVNRHYQALYDELRQGAKARFAAGLTPEQDVLQADVERTMLRQAALELEQQQSAIQAGINALLNRPGDAPVPAPGPLPPTTHLPPLAALRTFALEQHPSVRGLQFEQRAATEQVTLAEKSRFPDFRVSAGYNSMWDDHAMRPTVGVSINVPLDQSKRRAEIDAAQAHAHRAAASLIDLNAHLSGDLSAAYTAVVQTQKSVALYRDQLVPLAGSALELARSQYASGRSDFLHVIEAERSGVNAELGLARSEAELFKRLAELGRLAGTSLPIEVPRAGRAFNAAEAPHE